MYSTRLASAQLPLWNMLKKQKIDPIPFFNKVQLNPELMHKPGARYPAQRLNALLVEVQKQVKDQCFGLLVASAWHPSYAGSLGIALLMSMSIRDTLERLLRFHKVISDGHDGYLHEDQQQQTLSIIFKCEDGPQIPIGEDAFLAWLISLLRMNYQQDFAPVSVEFTHTPLDCVGKFYEYFHAPTNFNSETSQLTLPLNIVDQILPSGNKELVAFS